MKYLIFLVMAFSFVITPVMAQTPELYTEETVPSFQGKEFWDEELKRMEQESKALRQSLQENEKALQFHKRNLQYIERFLKENNLIPPSTEESV